MPKKHFVVSCFFFVDFQNGSSCLEILKDSKWFGLEREQSGQERKAFNLLEKVFLVIRPGNELN